jgi:hypothetical protein
VSDEQIGQPKLRAQVGQQVDDLGLNRDIEGRDRLVADDELGPQRKRPRDADALALSAAHLVGIAIGQAAGQSAEVQDILDPPVQINPPLRNAVNYQWLSDDLPHLHARVEGRIGVLENGLHTAPKEPRGLLVEPLDVLAVEEYLAFGRRDQLEKAACDGGLAATRLTDQPQSLAPGDGQVDPVHRLHLPDGALQDGSLGDRKMFRQALDLN